jgi:putative ABC transport system permease protein
MLKKMLSLRARTADVAATTSSMLVVVYKRLRHNLGLTISAIIGIVAVLGIVVCVPFFSYSVSSEVLRDQLQEKALNTRRALFSLHMYYQDSRSKEKISLDDTDYITKYLNETTPALVGVGVQKIYFQVQTMALSWKPAKIGADVSPEEDWASMAFFYQDDLPAHSDLVDGAWPQPAGADGPVQVAILEDTADKDFLNVGDILRSGNFDVQIVGIWRAKNSLESYWFDFPDTAFSEKLYIPIETLRNPLSQYLERPVFYSSWYLIFDENALQFTQASRYARGMLRLDAELRRILPGMKTDVSPLEALTTYQARADALTALFYAVGGPMVILALLFIALTAGIAVQQYEQETATIRGRGTSWTQVVALNLVESLALIIISLPLAFIVGWLEANLMQNTVSFLRFTGRGGLSFSLEGMNILWVLVGALFIILARLVPMWGLSRTTIVRMKQEQSRGSHKPLWQRFYLDFILLIPGIYSYLTMKGIAKPAKILAGLADTTREQYQDPLLFVAPALFAMALCMIAIRILPWVMRLLNLLFDRLPGVWAYLSMQQIARRPQDHSSALLLIMISLSLSIFSASTAKTLDQWQHDSLYYASGADLAIHEYAVIGGGPSIAQAPGSGGNSTTVSEQDLNVDSAMLLEEHLKLPNIMAVTRVGKYEGTFSFGVGEQDAVFMGIDRIDFTNVAFYREDFTGQSLGALMNTLADPNGVIVPSSVARKLGLRVGDKLNAQIKILGQAFDRELIVSSIYNYFPTVYPKDKPTLVVNLDSIFDNPESAIGYDLWLKVEPDTQTSLLLYQIKEMIGGRQAGIRVRGNAFENLKEAVAQPERMGLFGILNVGFIATGLMPGIGFVLYSYASLRRRFIQLGILQAIGLSVRQLIGYLVLEQFLLMGLAILLGAVIGLLTSTLFVPFLQVTATSGGLVPPFAVLIGWAESAWLSLAFAMILFLTVLGTIAYLAQIKVFQAVKMGETM